MSKSSKKTRRKNNLAKKRRKAALSGMQLEGLEPRQLLTATLGFESAQVVGNVAFTSEAENKAAKDASGPKLHVDGTLTNDAVVRFDLNGGTAEASDFSLSATFVVPAGDYTGGHSFDLLFPEKPNGDDLAAPFTVINDSLLEGDESVDISISPLTYTNTELQAGSNQRAIHTIQDNEKGEFRIQSGQIAEGDSGVSFQGIFVEIAKTGGDGTIDLEPGTTVKVKVDDVENTSPATGEAKTGTDYNAFSAKTVSFVSGQLTKGLFVETKGDTLIEGNEKIDFTLTSLVGSGDPLFSYLTATTDAAKRRVEIKDDESLTITFDKSTDSVREDNLNGSTLESGQRTVKAIATLTPGATLADDVKVKVDIGGNATLNNPAAGADYGFDAPVIAAGASTHEFTIPKSTTGSFTFPFELDVDSGTRDDSQVEGTETVTLTLDKSTSGPVFSKGQNSKYTLSIIDDEQASINIKSMIGSNEVTEITEGDNGDNKFITFRIQVNSSNTNQFDVDIPYTLSSSNGALHYSQVPKKAADRAPGTPDYGSNEAPADGSNGPGASTGTPSVARTGVVTVSSTNGYYDLNVPITNDMVLEGTENLTLTLGNVGINGTLTKQVNIKDNDAAEVTIAVTQTVAGGGIGQEVVDSTKEADRKDLKFKVVMSKPSSQDTIVTINRDSDSTASQSDYDTIFPINVTIPKGKTEAEVKVRINDDPIIEDNENLIVEITKVTGDPEAKKKDQVDADRTLVIQDTPDKGLVTIVASDPNATEGNNDGQFLVQLRAPKSGDPTIPSNNLVVANKPIVVNYTISGTAKPAATSGGPAADPNDYQTLSGTVTIPAGASSVPINVRVFDDAVVEIDETVVVAIDTLNVNGMDVSAAATQQQATVTITDDDGDAVVSVRSDDTKAAEAPITVNSNPNDGRFFITLAKVSQHDVTVNYALSGSATLGPDGNSGDYHVITNTLNSSGTVTIPAGVKELGPYVIRGNSDNLVEGDETVKLTISNPTIASGTVKLGTKDQTVTIQDEDKAKVTISRVSDLTEEPNGGTIGQFTVSLDKASTTKTVVKFATPSGPNRAVRGVDYDFYLENPGNGQNASKPVFNGSEFTFPAGTTSINVFVRGRQDLFVEGAEEIEVDLVSVTSGASSISLGGNASVFILDDDSATVSVKATDGKASEDGDKGELVFSVSNANVSEPIVVNYTLSGGSAEAEDVVGKIGTITIPANTTSLTVPIVALDDNLVEGPESLVFEITGITSGLNVGNPILGVGFDPFQKTAKVDIQDNEGAFVYLDFLSQNDKTANEDAANNAGFTSDRRVPIVIGLTENSGQTEKVRFSVGATGISSNADAEFSPGSNGTPNDGGQFKGDDFELLDRLNRPVTDVNSELKFVGQDAISGDYIYELTIPFGQRENSINLQAIHDDVVEGTERIRLELVPGSITNPGFSISSSRNSAEPTVSETDKVTVSLSDHDVKVHAGDSKDPKSPAGDNGALVEGGADTATVVVHINKPIEGQLDVSIGAQDGTATKGSGDYTLNGATTFSFTNVSSATTTSTDIIPANLRPTIKANNDTLAESTENFKLTATASHNNSANVAINSVGGRVDIVDNDFISISGVDSVTEESGGGNKTIKFQISARDGVANNKALEITTEEITADKPGSSLLNDGDVGASDFNSGTETVTFNKGKVVGGSQNDKTSYEFSVTINKDNVFEGDQQFRIRVRDTTSSGIQDVVKVVTIKDDDTVKITTEHADVTEGGTTTLRVRTDKAVEGKLEVPISVNGSGTASADSSNSGRQSGSSDFETNGITAGNTNKVTFQNEAAGVKDAFDVQTYGDTVVEKRETIGVAYLNKDLSAPKHTPTSNKGHRNDLVNSSPSSMKIKDDDQAKLEVSKTTVEGTEGGTVSYNVKLVGIGSTTAVQDAFTVSVAGVNGAAIGGAFQGSDYTFNPNALNFTGALGQSNTVTGTLLDDKVIETTEEFNLKHTVNAGGSVADGGADIATAPTVTAKIKDNDSTIVQIREEKDGSEGGSGSFVVGLKDGATTDVDTFVTVDILGTSVARPGVDYNVPIAEPVQSFNATNPSNPNDTSGSMIIRIPAGQNSVTIPINMLNDSIAEPTESINLREVNVSAFDPAIGGNRAINSPVVNSADDLGTVNIGPVSTANPTPSNVSISGSSWNVGAYSLTNHTASTLPWVNLNQLHITYPSAPSKTPTLTLTRGATPNGGAIAIPATAGAISGNAVTFSLGSVLEDGHYKATIDGNTVITFSVLHGDVAADASNVVAGPDFAVFAVHFGDTPSTIERYDLDGDGTVLGPDFARFAVTFANSLAGHQPASAQAMAAAVDSLFAEDADDDDDDNLGV